jgi:hypothetical protein
VRTGTNERSSPTVRARTAPSATSAPPYLNQASERAMLVRLDGILLRVSVCAPWAWAWRMCVWMWVCRAGRRVLGRHIAADDQFEIVSCMRYCTARRRVT